VIVEVKHTEAEAKDAAIEVEAVDVRAAKKVANDVVPKFVSESMMK
jgi:hypothetical protein